jgi:hypothetical protein
MEIWLTPLEGGVKPFNFGTEDAGLVVSPSKD